MTVNRQISSEVFTQELMDSIQRLDHWRERNGWAGYDPYDIRGHKRVLKLISSGGGNVPTRVERYVVLRGIAAYPLALRKLFGVRKQVNAKAMGLFASAYLSLYRQLKKESYLKKAAECLEWLEQNKSQGYHGAAWGYPFDWQSVLLIPKGTPSAVVSAACGHAFWDSYKLSGNQKHLEICQSIGEFFLRDLNLDQVSADRLCFSYTPLDKFHIHNANLFVAEFLIRVGKELKENKFLEHGLKALNYSLDAQNEDGSFYYWALSDGAIFNIPETTLKRVDHYHTGFVLRSLYAVYKSTGSESVYHALSKGYQFYRENLFEGRTIPKMGPNAKYPINIHSCAEAIVSMSTLSDLFPEALEYARNAFLWTRDNMQDKVGYFYFHRTARKVDKTPYIRWGQAWMMLAMARLLGSM